MDPTEIADSCDAVASRTDLVAFIHTLRRDFHENRDEWENETLERYLCALEGWAHDMPGYFRNQGLDETDQPTWNLVAQLLFAASMYE